MGIEEDASYVNWKDFNQVNDFNDRHILELNNYNLLVDNDRISDFIDYKLHYCNLLHEKLEFDEMLVILEQVSDLVSKLSVNHRNYQDSKTHMNFLLGIVCVNKKKFLKAYKIFFDLVKVDQKKYGDWLRHTRMEIFSLILNWILIFGVGLLILDFFLSFREGYYFDFGKFGFIILCIGLIIKKFLIDRFSVTHSKTPN